MNSELQIIPVTNKRQLRRFIMLPWKLYRNDPNWVPPLIMDQKKLLDRKKNPFFAHSTAEFFLAVQNGNVVGRIAALINDNHNKFHKEQTGFFGFFESIEDYQVAYALLQTAEQWLRQRNMALLRGPMNPSTNDTCGFLLEGFDRPPVIMMSYNPPYYLEFMEKYGMKKAKDLYAFYMETTTPMSDKIKRIAELVRRRHNVTIRSIDMKKFNQEIETVKYIYNQAWSRNWGFVPMTDEEFYHLAKDLKTVLEPELVLIAEVNGEPAGFSLALPDFNQALKRINGRLLPFGIFKLLWYSRKIDMLRVLTMGVIHKYQKLGIDAVFYYETYNRGKAKGIWRGEFSWILEDNYPMVHTLKKMGATVYKKYRIYDKLID
ncbi:N-acetyltransferase [candidate division KSB1 bacterium]|nr:MAG: N-acetyltransferase [candidate division KSB1 bacterium]